IGRSIIKSPARTGQSEPVRAFSVSAARSGQSGIYCSNISLYKSGTYYFVMGERKLLFSLPQALLFAIFERKQTPAKLTYQKLLFVIAGYVLKIPD
ncbi:MAG: hypothetical protein IKQ39_04355, partial [Oscillospiraceae bacterium]|nr:hypothetical protein [Oscillospiraceae bacterium]